MPPPQRPTAHADVLLLQPAGRADHFLALDHALHARGLRTHRVLPGHHPPRLAPSVRAVATIDVLGPVGTRILRDARETGAGTLLLMDGIAEHRNAHRQPRLDAHGPFLRPAPVHAVACAGNACRTLLEAWGNNAVPTGLPRLGPRPAPTPPPTPALLVATANRPAFDAHERHALLTMLANIRDRAHALRIPVNWRLTAGLDAELAVTNARGPLHLAFAHASAVLTTISTLLVEAMRAARPTALLHPFSPDPPHRAALTLNAGATDADIDHALRTLLDPDHQLLRAQEHALADAHAPDAPHAPTAADRLADLIAQLANQPANQTHAPHARTHTTPNAPPEHPPPHTHLHIVTCPGHPADATRALAALRHARSRRHVALLVAPHPALLPHDAWQPEFHGTRASYLLHGADHWRDLRELESLLLRAQPPALLTDGSDLAAALAARLAPHGIPAEPGHPAARLTNTPTLPRRRHPAERALTLSDHRLWRWETLDHPRAAERDARRVLTRMGCRNIATRTPTPHSDALIIPWRHTPPDPTLVAQWRARGLAVVEDLRLLPPLADHVASIIRSLTDDGAHRIAIYGTGAHTRRFERLFDMHLPIVALLDDAARPDQHAWGLPVLHPEHAIHTLDIDTVILSSDTFEHVLLERCKPLRAHGINIVPLYHHTPAGPRATEGVRLPTELPDPRVPRLAP